MFRNLSPRALGFSGTVQTEMLELALTYGFSGLDLDLVDFAQQVADFGLEDARRLLDAAKLKVGNFVLPVRWYDTDANYAKDMARLPGLAHLASELRCSRCVTTLRTGHAELPFNQNLEWHITRLREIGEVLGEHGVSLALEYVASAEARKEFKFEFVHDLDGMLKLLDEIDRPNVGLLVHSWQLYLGHVDFGRLRKLPPGRIVSVQVADAPKESLQEALTDADRRLPGETGVIDHVKLLRILKELDYTGPVTPAPLRGRIRGTGRQKAVEQTGYWLQELFIEAGLMVRPEPIVPTDDDYDEEEGGRGDDRRQPARFRS